MEKPLLTSAPLIKPIQDGTKTETRRLSGLQTINENPDRYRLTHTIINKNGDLFAVFEDIAGDPQSEWVDGVTIKSPYGTKGTTLWIRENWFVQSGFDDVKPRLLPKNDLLQVGYMADGDKPVWAGKTRPAIHIPRWLSRIDLMVKSVHLERLEQITEEGAKAERVPISEAILKSEPEPYRFAFFKTFIKLNGPDVVKRNPWVWVVKFNLKTPTQ
jgi:hypothetical protein